MEHELMAQCQWKLTIKTLLLQTKQTKQNMQPHVYLINKQILKPWAKNLYRSLWPEKFSQANSEWKQQRTWTNDGDWSRMS